MATTEPQKLPNTIISRCQRYDFKSINHNEMKKCLTNISEKENIKISDEALDEIILNSNGGMRDAIGLLDQAFVYTNNNIQITDIQSLSGGISDYEILEFYVLLFNKNYKAIIDKIRKYEYAGKDFISIAQKMLDFAYRSIIFKKTNNPEKLIESEMEFVRKNSDSKFYLIINMLGDTINELKKTYQKQLVFEVNMIKIMDKLTENFNVSRETLKKEKIDSLATDFKKNESTNTDLDEKIKKLKDIRINNILKDSSRQNLEIVNNLWKNIIDYLTDDIYKKSACILSEGKPVAVSDNGIIITFPVEILLEKIEKIYDLSKKNIEKLYNHKYKPVYITESYWQKIRPDYVQLVKQNQLHHKEEKLILSEIKKILQRNSVTEFKDLIEMEKE